MAQGFLSQGLMNWVADVTMAIEGRLREDVMYIHKTSATATPEASIVTMFFTQYRQSDIDMDIILPNDLRGHIPTASIAFAPTRHDNFVRPDGKEWKVMAPEPGEGMPFWALQCRQVA